MTGFPNAAPEREVVERFLARLAQTDPPMNALLEVALDHAQSFRIRLQTPVRIAFAGTSASGKSDLVNLLVGERLIEGQPAPGAPSTLVRHSHREQTIASWWDRPGVTFAGRDLAAAASLAPDFSVLEVDCEALEGLSLVDITGFDDAESSKRAVFSLMRLADVMLWCSRADNPMLRAESDNWKLVPARLIRNSMLILTHAEDVSQGDIEATTRKLTPERLRVFRQVIPISTRVAQIALDDPGPDFDELWQVSGAAQLVEAVIAAAVSVRESELDRIRRGIAQHIAPALASLDRINSDQPAAGPERSASATGVRAPALADHQASLPDAVRPASGPDVCASAADAAGSLLADWADLVRHLVSSARTGGKGSDAEFVVAVQQAVEGFGQRLDDQALPAPLRQLGDEFERASDLLTLLQFEAPAPAAREGARILLQLTDSLDAARV
jgi:hypothetical protein